MGGRREPHLANLLVEQSWGLGCRVSGLGQYKKDLVYQRSYGRFPKQVFCHVLYTPEYSNPHCRHPPVSIIPSIGQVAMVYQEQ